MARGKYKTRFDDEELARTNVVVPRDLYIELHRLSADRRAENRPCKLRDLIVEGVTLLLKEENLLN